MFVRASAGLMMHFCAYAVQPKVGVPTSCPKFYHVAFCAISTFYRVFCDSVECFCLFKEGTMSGASARKECCDVRFDRSDYT